MSTENTRLVRRTYSIEEVAELLGISRNAAYIAAREGTLPVPIIRVGKRRLVVSRAAFEAAFPPVPPVVGFDEPAPSDAT